jgi:hypothetical protein
MQIGPSAAHHETVQQSTKSLKIQNTDMPMGASYSASEDSAADHRKQ